MSAKLTQEEMWQHYIGCPRFGGRRVALNCVHLDRYRACRKWCPDLAAHLKAHPDFMEMVKTQCDGPALLSVKFSCKGVPNPHLVCPTCRFVAKSTRGLKIHKNRQHPVSSLWK